MCNPTAFAIVIGFCVSAGLPALGQEPPLGKPGILEPKSYSSPAVAFDAYRGAIARNDVATEVACLTPEFQEEQAYFFLRSTWIGFVIYPNTMPKLTATLKKSNGDAMLAQYIDEFKRKHGYDPAKAQANYERKAKLIQAGPAKPNELGQWREILDEKLLRKAVHDRITDKAAVVVAFHEVDRGADGFPLRYGPLRNIRLRGENATGLSTSTTEIKELVGNGRGAGQLQSVL